jgi:hypothetical protein
MAQLLLFKLMRRCPIGYLASASQSERALVKRAAPLTIHGSAASGVPSAWTAHIATRQIRASRTLSVATGAPARNHINSLENVVRAAPSISRRRPENVRKSPAQREEVPQLRNAAHAPGYAAGNILNLLLHLRVDLQDYDFSLQL